MNDDTRKLQNLVLAPWIIKATALIGIHRNVGGNQFRHGLATMAILLDYKLFGDYVLLKASVIHDLLEDVPDTNEYELRRIDSDADKVVDLVKEVTRHKDQPKTEFLGNLLEKGSYNAKVLKVADRISNLTDLHRDHYSREKMSRYLDQSQQFVLPMANEVNKDMAFELTDLISKRRQQLNFVKYPGFIGF
jgi:(p)ppGpp synthase/HD superfamily hydrolase